MRSERKMLPIGVENFEKLRRNDMYYVGMQICLPVPGDSAKH